MVIFIGHSEKGIAIGRRKRDQWLVTRAWEHRKEIDSKDTRGNFGE